MIEGSRELGVGAEGSPGGVEEAVVRSSAAFLLPPSMLNGRNQPEGAETPALDAAGGVPLTEAVEPAEYSALVITIRHWYYNTAQRKQHWGVPHRVDSSGYTAQHYSTRGRTGCTAHSVQHKSNSTGGIARL